MESPVLILKTTLAKWWAKNRLAELNNAAARHEAVKEFAEARLCQAAAKIMVDLLNNKLLANAGGTPEVLTLVVEHLRLGRTKLGERYPRDPTLNVAIEELGRLADAIEQGAKTTSQAPTPAAPAPAVEQIQFKTPLAKHAAETRLLALREAAKRHADKGSATLLQHTEEAIALLQAILGGRSGHGLASGAAMIQLATHLQVAVDQLSESGQRTEAETKDLERVIKFLRDGRFNVRSTSGTVDPTNQPVDT